LNRRSPEQRGARGLPFWLVSTVLHGVVLVVLVLALPVRTIMLREESAGVPPVITRGDELQEIIDAVRDLTAERLRARVMLLEEGQERMARNFGIVNAHFLPFAAQQRATARSRLESYLDETLALQRALRDACVTARHAATPGTMLAAARVQTARVLAAQDEVRRGILLLDLETNRLAATQRAAQDAQIAANQKIRALDDVHVSITRREEAIAAGARELATVEQRVAEATSAVQRLEQHWRAATNDAVRADEAFVQSHADLTTAQQRLRGIEDQLAHTNRLERDVARNAQWRKRDPQAHAAALQEYQAALQQLNTARATARRAADAVRDHNRQLERARDDARRRAGDAQRDLARARDHATRQHDEAAHARARLSAARAERDTAVSNRTALLDTVYAAQTHAYEQERKVAEEIRRALDAAPRAQEAQP